MNQLTIKTRQMMDACNLERRAIGFLSLLFLGCLAVVVFALKPIAQPLEYHQFADIRGCFGISNCGDVLSNVGFALAGIYGLFVVLFDKTLFRPDQRTLKNLFLLFFSAVTAVSIGSTYYHLDPDNVRLFWDRLPITLAFLALFPAILADRINAKSGVYIAAAAIPAGVGALLYWLWSEMAGAGDLRFYGLVQAYPLLCLVLVPWLLPEARFSQTRFIYSMVGLYGVAKVMELFDEQILTLTGQLISGHSMKHLVAAAACLVVVPMIRAGAKASRQELLNRPAAE